MNAVRLFGLSALMLPLIGCDLVSLPPAKALPEVHWSPEQNWSKEMTNHYYFTPQGSEVAPYDWLVALEQPKIPFSLLGSAPRFFEADYISRLGFLPAEKSPLNPAGLPVGFVKDDNWVNPHTGQKQVMGGFTCATCHTGQLEITGADGKKQALRVDGGAAMIDLQRFEKALGTAFVLTQKIPTRFDRFAHNVLGQSYSSETKKQLKESLDAFIEKGLHEQKLLKQHNVFPHEPGFGRVDALNRIGNQVFGLEVNPNNLYTANAPVAYPHLWGAGWFNYVQYNGSVPQPLVRNVGEALGVKTPFVGKGKPEDLFKSSVHVENLWQLEEWLSGSAPYEGLKAPVWPVALFGDINTSLAQQGAALYQEHCSQCHLPAGDALKQDRLAASPRYWTATNFRGDKLLNVVTTPLDTIGTDPNQAQDFITRQVETDDIGKGKMLAGAALDYVTNQVVQRYFTENNIPEDAQIAWNNGHKLGAESARVIPAYKARPLDGIWATPPYLHNGSVPNLYALLATQEERPSRFALGTHEYDTKTLGYVTAPFKGATEFNTALPGNSNSGHEFADKPNTKGVIGPKLTEEQRMALLEFLKTL